MGKIPFLLFLFQDMSIMQRLNSSVFLLRDGRFRIGDEIINVNGKRLRGVTLEEAQNALRTTAKEVDIVIARDLEFDRPASSRELPNGSFVPSDTPSLTTPTASISSTSGLHLPGVAHPQIGVVRQLSRYDNRRCSSVSSQITFYLRFHRTCVH
jgi:hypothetical protein